MKKTLSISVFIGLAFLAVVPLTSTSAYSQNAPIAARSRSVRDGDNKQHTPYMDESGPRKEDRPLRMERDIPGTCAALLVRANA
jgi:hypothetical protein